MVEGGGREAFEDEDGNDGSQSLRAQVEDSPDQGDLPGDEHRDGDCGVDVAATDVGQGGHQQTNEHSETQGDLLEAGQTRWCVVDVPRHAGEAADEDEQEGAHKLRHQRPPEEAVLEVVCVLLHHAAADVRH